MKKLKDYTRTDCCGRYAGRYITYLLNQDEWNEKAKELQVRKPYQESMYHLGCGWSNTTYEMAMLASEPTGCHYWMNGWEYPEVANVLYLLEGHEKPLADEIRETMNEYNS